MPRTTQHNNGHNNKNNLRPAGIVAQRLPRRRCPPFHFCRRRPRTSRFGRPTPSRPPRRLLPQRAWISPPRSSVRGPDQRLLGPPHKDAPQRSLPVPPLVAQRPPRRRRPPFCFRRRDHEIVVVVPPRRPLPAASMGVNAALFGPPPNDDAAPPEACVERLALQSEGGTERQRGSGVGRGEAC